MNDLGIKDIKKYIPHEYPFLFVDKVLDYEIGKSIEVIKNVSYNEWYFSGHFPGNPIMPGVILQESMAQAAAILAGLSLDLTTNNTYLLTSSKIKYKGIVRPGDQLKLSLNVKKMISHGGIFKGKAYVENRLVAEAELGFMIR